MIKIFIPCMKIQPIRMQGSRCTILPNLPIDQCNWTVSHPTFPPSGHCIFYGMVENIRATLSSGITENHSKALHNTYIFDDPTLFQVNVSKNIVPKAHDGNNLLNSYNTFELCNVVNVAESETLFFFYTCGFAKTGTSTDHGKIFVHLFIHVHIYSRD